MNYNQAINWLYSFQKFGIKLELDRIKFICKKLENPQDNYTIIHVGGTNGKGSVCRFIGSILSCAGYKTGIYTSPHLQRFSERFLINDKEISDEKIIELVEKIKPIVQEMIKKDNIPTFFEIVTAMAFEYFSDEHVDHAIIEVGLGGRFDATNIVNPLLSIITNVSLEHQDKLGKKIEDIAFEKSGIIKENTAVLTAATVKALEVIEKIAKEKKSSIKIVNNTFWEKIGGGLDWQQYIIHGFLKDYNVKTCIPGSFQGQNLALALCSIEVLQMKGVYITDENIQDGVLKTTNPGRMEIINFEPCILLDGAHNVSGIKALKESLGKDFVFEKLILVIGILKDKNIKEMLKIIAPVSDVIIVTKSNNDRACNPIKLKEMIKKDDVVVKNSISEALEYAKKVAKKQDLICVTGSLFTVGEARELLL